MRKLAVLLFLLMSAGLFASDLERRPRDEAYIDNETGAVFPAVISNFLKTEVVRNFNPMIGTVARYSDNYGNCADVYIYTIHARENKTVSRAEAERHFHEIKNAILQLPRKKGPVSSVVLIGEDKFSQGAKIHGRKAVFTMNLSGEIRCSELVVFPFQDRIVKLRISTSTQMPDGKAPELFFDFVKNICMIFENATKQ